MKRILLLIALLSLLLLLLQTARAASEAEVPGISAAPFTLDWWSVDGGGGTSSGGAYTLSGTIGQVDAATARGGDYALAGGFWARLLEAWKELFLPFTTK
jgi:hypothetical protein